ncbi:MBL fold metallo-hydrolase [Comamonadaceae bacterium OH2310_COT-174]|nr:MBL fold metallo-hydrolase [Comamonadaceae bacterium OH2310_COT-174]
MIRPEYFLHPPFTPAPTRPAVTLILVRDAPQGQGFEVLLSRRSHQARFVPGVYVFPGGGIDAGDAAAAALADLRPQQDARQAELAAAAVRECLEELGILLARDAQGRMLDGQTLAAAGIARQQPLAPQLQRLGWRLALDAIYPFAHWITDRDYPMRFDVPFLLARAPQGQQAMADEVEQFDATWISPALALQRHEQGQLPLVYPTIRSLRRLAQFDSAEAVLAACRQGPIMPVSCPRAGWLDGREVRYMEHEPAFGELHLVCPDGQLLHELDWRHDQPRALLRHVQRLTAPNAGLMTGPGTNTYLIGEPATGYIVLDPGPDDAQHLQRIVQHTGAQVRHIVCSHSHPDHSPGAAPLQALVQAAAGGLPSIYGMASGPHARRDSRFTPEQPLGTGDTLVLQGQLGDGRVVRHSLHALHTPGHTANHLCFVLEEDGLLFSGDHILGGTTTVVLPPDGSMQAFLDSLDLLQQACTRWGIEFILPAHGHVLDQAPQVIAQLRHHRLQREAKVLQAIEQAPQGTVDDWLASAYADAPRALWPVARYSLLAHVQRLAALHPQLGLQRIPMPEPDAVPH